MAADESQKLIHLEANCLIVALGEESPEGRRLQAWLKAGAAGKNALLNARVFGRSETL